MGVRLSMAFIIVSAIPVVALDRVPYGSRVGMNATVTRVEGIGTANAVIYVKHLPENAREFCIEYANDRSRACVERTLRDVRISNQLHGNCRTGYFTTVTGTKLLFEGPNKKRDILDTKYRFIGVDGLLDGSSASGYSTALAQFQALCPGLVDTSD